MPLSVSAFVVAPCYQRPALFPNSSSTIAAHKATFYIRHFLKVSQLWRLLTTSKEYSLQTHLFPTLLLQVVHSQYSTWYMTLQQTQFAQLGCLEASRYSTIWSIKPYRRICLIFYPFCAMASQKSCLVVPPCSISCCLFYF